MNKLKEKDVAESGLSWGFELESLAVSILGDEEMEENKLIDFLLSTKELQPLFEKWRKRPTHKPDGTYRTVREELWYLLNDITTEIGIYSMMTVLESIEN